MVATMTTPRDRCEICGQAATVHAVAIAHGRRSERHLCAKHADQGAIPHAVLPQAAGGAWRVGEVVGALGNLKACAKFLRRHGRMPKSIDELLQGMADPGDSPAVPLADPRLAERLYFMDAMIRFWESHGRAPLTADEAASVGLEWDKNYGNGDT